VKLEVRKTISKTLVTVTLSSFLGFLAARISGVFDGKYDVYIAVFFVIILIAFGSYIVFFEHIEEYFWSVGEKRNLENPVFAIIKQEGCPRKMTRFTPEDWRQRLEELGSKYRFEVKIISINQISNKYSVIINPYGEYYPEEDLAELRTLQKIKNYISEAGMFINVGGIAFYYGWNAVRKREATLAKELEGYQELQIAGSRILTPTRLWPNYVYSLVETPLADHFKVLTTGGGSRNLQVYQEDTDRKYVGDLKDVGGTDYVQEFRAAREPLRNGQPLLRARPFPEEDRIVIYPLIAIPHNKGCLILGGMNLNSGIEHDGIDLDKAQRDKIIQAIINLVENQRKEYVPFDWRKPVR